MKSLEDIKKFEDIDTYYDISELVSEIFVDRVEAHKHLVSANKEIERLNNIIDELEKYLEQEIIVFQDEYDEFTEAQVQEDKIILEKLKELKQEN